MSQRFFVPPIKGQTATLEGPETHHLLHVMRAKPGDQVTLFDGSGAEWLATVATVSRSRVDFELGSRQEIDRELPFSLVLGVALPKGDRQKSLVDKLTQLGVTRLVPLQTERSIVVMKDSALQKLRRTVIEASKQCGRNRLMVIDQPRALPAFVDEAAPEAARLIAHPTGNRLTPPPISNDCWLAIGPEGGFTDDEVATAIAQGWGSASLGPRILRIETAAQAFAAVLSFLPSA